MKCPNCSFVNTDDIKTCRVCGFDLTPIEDSTSEKTSKDHGPSESFDSNASAKPLIASDTKISKRRMIDDSEDEALDSAFKSIFGNDDGIDEDPLDVATVERILQKKRYIQPILSEDQEEVQAEGFVDEDDTDVSPSFDDEDTIVPLPKKKVVLIIGLTSLLLILLAIKFLLPDFPWKYESSIDTTETTVIDTTEVENTTETVISLGEDASIVPVNDFFNLLPDFINQGNLSILALFENSQEALEVLTHFAVIGNLEKIAEATVSDSEITEDSATYSVSTLTNRLIDGQQTQTASVWDFRAINKNDKWILESLSVETGQSVVTDTTEPVAQEATQTTEKATEATTEKQTESTKEATTEEITTAEITTDTTSQTLLNGFKSSGSFSGGAQSSGQDIAFARYGSHDSYERLAFDLYEWIGGKPDQPAGVINSYTAGISDDGRTISIMVNGAVEAYASQASLNLINSANIESVSYNYFGNGEAVAITISLKRPCQFKVFNLESPAKLVVDIATFE